MLSHGREPHRRAGRYWSRPGAATVGAPWFEPPSSRSIRRWRCWPGPTPGTPPASTTRRWPADAHVRRPGRRARHVVDRAGVGVVPVRLGARRDLGPRPRPGASAAPSGREAHSKSAQVAAGADRQPPPHADQRAQLRVPERGPGARRRVRRRLRAAASRTKAWRACIKHFVGNETEFERMTISAEIDERTLRELYLVPFEAAVQRAGVRAVMSAYNRLNGTYCADHQWLLTEVLRGEWGFDGVVSATGSAATAPSSRCAPGSTSRCPGRRSTAGSTCCGRRVDAGEVERAELDAAVDRLLDLAEWTKAAQAGTAETTADDPRDPRRDPPGGGSGDRAAEERRRARCRSTAPRRSPSIGPYARFGRHAGWRQRPGHARPRPRAVRCAAARAARRHVRDRRLDRQVPADDARRLHRRVPTTPTARRPRSTTSRLAWYWDKAPAAGIDATRFGAARHRHVRARRDRRLGASACGPSARSACGSTARRVLDHRRAADRRRLLRHGQPGGPRARSPLEEGRRYAVEVDYPEPDDADLVRGPGRRRGAGAGGRRDRAGRGRGGRRRRRRRDRRHRRRLGDRGRGPHRRWPCRATQDDARRRRRRRQPAHDRGAQHRLAGDDAVARRRRRRCCSCGSPARRSATRWPTCCSATSSPAAGCR